MIPTPGGKIFQYPVVRRDETVTDDYHGKLISDPYRWLEDPDSEETKAFVEAQNNLTTSYLQSCPVRKDIKKCVTKFWDYPTFSCPSKEGQRYFIFKNTGLQNQYVLYMQDSLESKAKATLFFDPNLLSEDGTIALGQCSFSKDGKIFAYSLAKSGSDWITIHFKKVDTGEDYPEILYNAKFTGIEWTHDNKGVFYGCYPDQEGKTDGSETTTNENQKLYYHRIGTSQAEDTLVVDFPDNPKWMIGAEVSDCGSFLIVSPVQECDDNLLYYVNIEQEIKNGFKSKLLLSPVITKFEADYKYITNDGPVFLFRTNKNAPNFRLIKIDFTKPEEEFWTTLIPEHLLDVLQWACCVNGDKLVICYIHDVKDTLRICNLSDGSIVTHIPLDVGSVCSFTGERKLNEFFFLFGSFLTPGRIFHIDFTVLPLNAKLYKEIILNGFDASKFTAKQIFYPSKDGVEIPMFIVCRTDFKPSGSTPCLLYGYGGFNISIQPSFSVARLVFLKHFNGISVIANIRGGGEYGRKWHDDGTVLNKQTGLNDFQCAAEYLITNKYTNSSKLIIQGASNGGLLVGACVNQRPDLFGAGIAHVGVMDMLRFQKFTIGYGWSSDYGCSDSKEQFECLIKYSPLHNVRIPKGPNCQYPAILLLTADHDDRVVPLHSFKFISELQHKLATLPAQTNPLMIRIETKAGHGGGKPTGKKIDEITDIFSFVVQSLRIKFVPRKICKLL